MAPKHKGKGNMMVWGKADWDRGLGGRPVMERLYDFNALPGTRKLVRQFLLQKFAFVDTVGKAEQVEEMPKDALSRKTRSFLD